MVITHRPTAPAVRGGPERRRPGSPPFPASPPPVRPGPPTPPPPSRRAALPAPLRRRRPAARGPAFCSARPATAAVRAAATGSAIKGSRASLGRHKSNCASLKGGVRRKEGRRGSQGVACSAPGGPGAQLSERADLSGCSRLPHWPRFSPPRPACPDAPFGLCSFSPDVSGRVAWKFEGSLGLP